jgi:hypothetical protein
MTKLVVTFRHSVKPPKKLYVRCASNLYSCVFVAPKKAVFMPHTSTDWFLQPRERLFAARYELNIYTQFKLYIFPK